MQPTPETLEALRLLEDQGDHTVALTLDAFAVRAGAIVPDLVGLTFAMFDPGITFAMTSDDIADAEGVQPPVGSSLAMPLTYAEQVIGGISLYAESPTAFIGRHAALANVLGADPTDVIPDADLDFWSRLRAGSAAAQIREHDVIEQAVGFIASARDTEPVIAEQLLRDTAGQSGISEADTARAVLRRQIDIP